MKSYPGLHCPVGLPNMWWDDLPDPVLLGPLEFDNDGLQRGKRINGWFECPKCMLWWPCVEEPEEWTRDYNGRGIAISWWGAAYCDRCGLLLLTQPDGTADAYDVS